MVGLGGVWTEALNDVRLMPAGLSRERVIEEIQRLKGSRVLRGARGALPADIEALADSVVRIGAVVCAQPEITEIDINPLVVLPAGAGVIALDALIVTRS